MGIEMAGRDDKVWAEFIEIYRRGRPEDDEDGQKQYEKAVDALSSELDNELVRWFYERFSKEWSKRLSDEELEIYLASKKLYTPWRKLFERELIERTMLRKSNE